MTIGNGGNHTQDEWVDFVWCDFAVHGWQYEFFSATGRVTDLNVINRSQNDLADQIVTRVQKSIRVPLL